MIHDDLFQQLLMSPAADGCDGVVILTGYASPSLLLFHLLEAEEHLHARVSLDLRIGMTGESGLDILAHHAFRSAIDRLGGRASVTYSPRGSSDHSKTLVWTRMGRPERAWTGSANYTFPGYGLGGVLRRETMTQIDPELAIQDIRASTADWVDSADPDLPSRLQLVEIPHLGGEDGEDVASLSSTRPSGEPVELPLVQTTRSPGEIHNPGAGLNWGARGSRRRSEAYIPVPSAVARSGFFPRHGLPFALHTTDGETLFMTVAQGGDKALHSVPDNAEIGLYFRRRLGVDEESLITTDDLRRFGATSVRVWRSADGSYLMEFEPFAS